MVTEEVIKVPVAYSTEFSASFEIEFQTTSDPWPEELAHTWHTNVTEHKNCIGMTLKAVWEQHTLFSYRMGHSL